jgi:methionyl aminopeptidase
MITIHSKNDFVGMRSAGKLAAETLDYITPHIKEGVTTNYLNDLCHEFIVSNGGIPAPLNYNGFPKSICTSVNDVACHGIPDETKLRDGDTLNIDVTAIVDGWHGDTSRMYIVGNPTPMTRQLMQVTYNAMMIGIEKVKPGVMLGDIGHAIQSYIKGYKFSVVKSYCGHGIGKKFHDEPCILHYGTPGTGAKLREGMFFTIEPIVNQGKHHTNTSSKDGWTVTTRDHSISAQFEHTIGVTSTGFEIFTSSPENKHKPPYER